MDEILITHSLQCENLGVGGLIKHASFEKMKKTYCQN